MLKSRSYKKYEKNKNPKSTCMSHVFTQDPPVCLKIKMLLAVFNHWSNNDCLCWVFFNTKISKNIYIYIIENI